MTLAAVIERSRTDREAWRYTDLARIEELFRSCGPVIASVPKGTRSNPVPSSSLKLGLDYFAPNDARNDNSMKARLIFLNGLLQLGKNSPSLLTGDTTEGYRLAVATGSPDTLDLLFLTEPGMAPGETTTKLHIALAPNSRLNLIEWHTPAPSTTESPFAHLLETTVELGENATLTHAKIVRNNGAPPIAHIARTAVNAAQGATYDSFALLRGGALTRNEIHVTLGEAATCNLNGAMLLRGEDHADTTTHIVHAAPHGQSNQNYRSVLANKARGVFQGKTTVNEGAQKTDAHQLCRALLLSHQAEMDAKPELEIYADDVKCSHGCAIGNLEDEALFYLRSRGIGEGDARALLIESFVNEIANEIRNPASREAVHNEIRSWLNG